MVRENSTQNIYALKVIRKKDAIEKNNLGKIILERDILVKADNPYVVTLYYAFQSVVSISPFLFIYFSPTAQNPLQTNKEMITFAIFAIFAK